MDFYCFFLVYLGIAQFDMRERNPLKKKAESVSTVRSLRPECQTAVSVRRSRAQLNKERSELDDDG